MQHSNKVFPYLIGAAAVSEALITFGAPIASLAPFAIVLVCPLMMVVMMRGMGGMNDCEDTPATAVSTTRPRNRVAHQPPALTRRRVAVEPI